VECTVRTRQAARRCVRGPAQARGISVTAVAAGTASAGATTLASATVVAARPHRVPGAAPLGQRRRRGPVPPDRAGGRGIRIDHRRTDRHAGQARQPGSCGATGWRSTTAPASRAPTSRRRRCCRWRWRRDSTTPATARSSTACPRPRPTGRCTRVTTTPRRKAPAAEPYAPRPALSRVCTRSRVSRVRPTAASSCSRSSPTMSRREGPGSPRLAGTYDQCRGRLRLLRLGEMVPDSGTTRGGSVRGRNQEEREHEPTAARTRPATASRGNPADARRDRIKPSRSRPTRTPRSAA